MTDTTQLAPGGEVTLPPRVREQLGLKTGDKFEVIIREGEIILRRTNQLPGAKELEQFLAAAKKAGAGSKVVDVKEKHK